MTSGTWPKYSRFLPPALAEEVIFSVASVSLCICLRPTGWTVEPTDLKFDARIKDHHISDEFKGQGHQGQKCQNSSFQSSFRKGRPRSRSRGSRSKVVGQGDRVKVKDVWEVLYPIDSLEVRHAGVFITIKMVDSLVSFLSSFWLFFSFRALDRGDDYRRCPFCQISASYWNTHD